VNRGPADVAVAAHAFVVDLDAPVLADDDHHHLERVLRLTRGTLVTVSDGCGRWRLARFGPQLEPAGPIECEPAAKPRLTIGFALVKGTRPELIVQKLTEIGIDRVLPFVAENSVVRWDADRAQKHVRRLRRVAKEAAMQCRRAWLPAIDDLVTFADLIDGDGLCVAERGGTPVTLAHPTILVGPEGGWSHAERQRGLPAVSLGPHVLRSETAAIVASALLTTLRVQNARSHPD
jgi:16S rRNA (uracil1498-N3)-methyltransferase